MNRHPTIASIALGAAAISTIAACAASTSHTGTRSASPVAVQSAVSASQAATVAPVASHTASPTATRVAPRAKAPVTKATASKASPARTATGTVHHAAAPAPKATAQQASSVTTHSTSARALCKHVVNSRPGYNAPGWSVSCVPMGDARLGTQYGDMGNTNPDTHAVYVGYPNPAGYDGLLYITAHELSHAQWWSQLSSGNRAWWSQAVSGSADYEAGGYSSRPIERYADTRARCLGFLRGGFTTGYRSVSNGCSLLDQAQHSTASVSPKAAYNPGSTSGSGADSLASQWSTFKAARAAFIRRYPGTTTYDHGLQIQTAPPHARVTDWPQFSAELQHAVESGQLR